MNTKYNFQRVIITAIQLLILLFISANLLHASDQTSSKILAKVNGKVITVKDFSLRSELTIRPKNFIDKKTILNNLIIEKLMSIEAQNNDQIKNNQQIKDQVKGIKEQTMRDKLFELMLDSANVDSNSLFKSYSLSSRAYQVEFYTINSNTIAENINQFLTQNPSSADSLFELFEQEIGKQPEHIVKFDDPEADIIHDALFTDSLSKGTSIGPLKLSNNNYILMKVLDWIDYPVVGYVEQQKRLNSVKEKLIRKKANKSWNKFQANLMGGKKVEFNLDAFEKLSSIAFEDYNTLNNPDSLNVPLQSISFDKAEVTDENTFFSIDGERWSVNDFRIAMRTHPLVFRSKNLTDQNFHKEFRFAVLDLIKNHFITQEAYNTGIDKLATIKDSENNWNDALSALYHGRTYLEEAENNKLFSTDNVRGKQLFWNEYINKVIAKYESKVEIDFDLLNKIKPTNIEYFVMRQGVPYPVPVPSFPTFTNSKILKFKNHLK